jgi:hypothetical protein
MDLCVLVFQSLARLLKTSTHTCRANDEGNKEYSVHLVGPELNIHVYIYTR